PLSNPGSTPSPSGFRKRKSYESEDYDSGSASAGASPSKKVKIDDEELDHAPWEQPQNGADEKEESDSHAD
ncbi:hypothetical protein PHISCL_11274, partial [Aspergillus sclerotialis]